jgi:hypothetical protein
MLAHVRLDDLAAEVEAHRGAVGPRGQLPVPVAGRQRVERHGDLGEVV